MIDNYHVQAGQGRTVADAARVPARKPWQAPALSELAVNETQQDGGAAFDGVFFT